MLRSIQQTQEEIGKELVALLKLKYLSNGQIRTAWGAKTLVGLASCVERLFVDAGVRVDYPEASNV